MIWAYLAGLATLPGLVGVYSLISWATGRNRGSSGCIACNHLTPYEIGDYSNITAWLISARHDAWWSFRGWHRNAVKAQFAKWGRTT